MRHRQPLSFLSWMSTLVLTVGSVPGSAQQTTDPFTGEHGNTGQPLNLPDANSSRRADEGKLLIRSQTVLVQVPTVVTDKSGNHIHNLTKEDFKVLENGKQQRIAVFEEVTATRDRPAQAMNPPSMFSNLLSAGQQPQSVTVIALDTINTPFLDQSNGRRQLFQYLATVLDSGHVFGLVVMGRNGVKVLGPLNSDPASLIAAVKQASGELSAMETFGTDGKAMAAPESHPGELPGNSIGGDPIARMRHFIENAEAIEGAYHQEQAIENTMKDFLTIAWSLAGIPGRKSLIWATGNFPFSLDSPSTVPVGNLSVLYERTMEALNDAQISVYPVDVRGLVSASPVIDAAESGRPAATDSTAAGRNWLQDTSQQSLENFAAMTGGRAYTNNNDLATGFRRAAEDSSSYYLLGYYADHRSIKPGWRTLQVQLARKDLEVRARTGFLVTNATSDPQLTHQADVGLALSSPFDSTGLQVTLKWQGVAPDGDKKKIGFALNVPTAGVIDEADQNRFDIDFVVQATRNGTPAGDAGQTVKGTIPAAALPKIKAEGIFYHNALDLAAGDYQVRFVVRDNLRGRIGSITAPLTVQ